MSSGFLNNYDDYKEVTDRTYFYGVLVTVHSKYMRQLVTHANRFSNRNYTTASMDKTIDITYEIIRILEDESFVPSKCSPLDHSIEYRGRVIYLLKTKPRALKIEVKYRKQHELIMALSENI